MHRDHSTLGLLDPGQARIPLIAEGPDYVCTVAPQGQSSFNVEQAPKLSMLAPRSGLLPFQANLLQLHMKWSDCRVRRR